MTVFKPDVELMHFYAVAFKINLVPKLYKNSKYKWKTLNSVNSL